MLLALQIFFVVCCLVMILVVLMQRSEDGGVAGMLGGDSGGAIFGTKTINVLARFTAGLGAVMLVLIIMLSKMSSSETSLMDDVDPAPPLSAEPVANTPASSPVKTTDTANKAADAPAAPITPKVPVSKK